MTKYMVRWHGPVAVPWEDTFEADGDEAARQHATRLLVGLKGSGAECFVFRFNDPIGGSTQVARFAC